MPPPPGSCIVDGSGSCGTGEVGLLVVGRLVGVVEVGAFIEVGLMVVGRLVGLVEVGAFIVLHSNVLFPRSTTMQVSFVSHCVGSRLLHALGACGPSTQE